MKIRTKYREQIAFTPKKKPQNSLSLSLSKRTKPKHQTIRGHQNKRNNGCECCAWDFIIFGKSGSIGFLAREGKV